MSGPHERGLPSSLSVKELYPQNMRCTAHTLLCSSKFPMSDFVVTPPPLVSTNASQNVMTLLSACDASYGIFLASVAWLTCTQNISAAETFICATAVLSGAPVSFPTSRQQLQAACSSTYAQLQSFHGCSCPVCAASVHPLAMLCHATLQRAARRLWKVE